MVSRAIDFRRGRPSVIHSLIITPYALRLYAHNIFIHKRVDTHTRRQRDVSRSAPSSFFIASGARLLCYSVDLCSHTHTPNNVSVRKRSYIHVRVMCVYHRFVVVVVVETRQTEFSLRTENTTICECVSAIDRRLGRRVCVILLVGRKTDGKPRNDNSHPFSAYTNK